MPRRQGQPRSVYGVLPHQSVVRNVYRQVAAERPLPCSTADPRSALRLVARDREVIPQAEQGSPILQCVSTFDLGSWSITHGAPLAQGDRTSYSACHLVAGTVLRDDRELISGRKPLDLILHGIPRSRFPF